MARACTERRLIRMSERCRLRLKATLCGKLPGRCCVGEGKLLEKEFEF